MDRSTVTALFDKLRDDNEGFFAQVADKVDWMVEGSHPLAGRYASKGEFIEHTFAKLAKVYRTERS